MPVSGVAMKGNMKSCSSWFEWSAPCARTLILSLILCLANSAGAAPKKVLFYGPTHQTGGVGETLIANNPTEFAQVGQGSAIWSAQQWSAATVAQFQAFDAIVIGDHTGQTLSEWFAAIANRSVWSAAVAGDNILIFGGDPEDHTGNAGAVELIRQGIRFAAEGTDAGPGLFIVFSDIQAEEQSPLDPTQPVISHLLSGLGTFEVIGVSANSVRKLASHPVTDCTTDSELSDWSAACHSGFLDWPQNAGWTPLALVTDVLPGQRTPPALLPSGEQGLVHALAKGSFNQFVLTPALGGHLLNQQHTLTARYLDASGAGIQSVGIVFDVTDGPNVSQGPASRPTDANGVATWTYTGNGGIGRDTIEATAVVSGDCLPNARAFCDWSDRLVTISAPDPNAAEPAFQGGSPNSGTLVVTRMGNIGGGFFVSLNFNGTAALFGDYDLDPSVPSGFTFDPGQTSQTITVTPLWDGQSEPVETVIASIVPEPSGTYAVGTPSEATVFITSSEPPPTVTLTVIGSATVDETGA